MKNIEEKLGKYKYAVAALIIAVFLTMVFFGVNHDGFDGLNK